MVSATSLHVCISCVIAYRLGQVLNPCSEFLLSTIVSMWFYPSERSSLSVLLKLYIPQALPQLPNGLLTHDKTPPGIPILKPP